jgi:hypothetical protein
MTLSLSQSLTRTANLARALGHVRAHALLLVGASLLSGCALFAPPPPAPPPGPTPEQIEKVERTQRANDRLSDGLKSYEAGAFEPAMTGFLVALDSGLLTLPQQLDARKHIAFMHCVSSRESNCREEFEKVLALDPKFELSPAEAGHPIWGAVFRSVKSQVEARRNGRTTPVPPPKVLTTGERLLNEGLTQYDDGAYAKSVMTLQDALKETLSMADQVKARKFVAFGLCLTARTLLCRQEFERILAMQADFELSAAEVGHPSWGPSFRAAKARVKSQTPPTKK